MDLSEESLGDDASILSFEEFWQSEVSRQNEELSKWLDDFLASKEFNDNLMKKKRPNDDFADENTQTINLSEEVVQERISPQYMLFNKIQGVLKTKEVQNTIRNQEIGISIIKDKIASTKVEHQARKVTRIQETHHNREELLQTLRNEYAIVFPKNSRGGNLAFEKIEGIKQRKRLAQARKRKNTINIVQKILTEIKRDEADKKVKKTERIVSKLEIVGTKIKLEESDQNTTQEESEILDDFEDQSDYSNITEKVKKVKQKEKGNQKEIKKTKEKTKKVSISTKSKSKKSVKEKESKEKKKKGSTDCEIPIAPKVNSQVKISLEQMESLDVLLQNLIDLEKFLKEKQAYQLEQEIANQNPYSEDKKIQIDPPNIIFENVLNGCNYKKKVIFKNIDRFLKKVRFNKIIWNADIEDPLVNVEPLGAQKILPGLSCEMIITFSPENIDKSLEASIRFLSYSVKSKTYQECILNFFCTAFSSKIIINPKIIFFKEVPIWEARNKKKFKIFNIKNEGAKECKVVISKVFTKNMSQNVDGEEENEEEISGGEEIASYLLQECIENVFNNFQFSHNVFNLQGGAEIKVKVWINMVENSSFCVETYSVKVFEIFHDNLYLVGNEDITIKAETFGNFLLVEPEVLDFKVCAYGSAYQLFFNVINPTKATHTFKIRFPASLRSYFSCNYKEVVIQPKSSYKVFIKFTPILGIIEDNRNFFDEEIELFEFPFLIYLATRGWEEAPPVKISVFVAVTESSGLILRPLNITEYQKHNGDYLMDLGVCSFTETPWKDFEIFNTSLLTQHYGFLDLPSEIMIMPNYGFGSLLPKETAVLRVFFSPKFEDFKNYTLNDGSDFRVFLKKITVTSVRELASFKKPVDLKFVNKRLSQLEAIIKKPPKENEALLSDIKELQNLIVNSIKTDTTLGHKFSSLVKNPDIQVEPVEKSLSAVVLEEKQVNVSQKEKTSPFVVSPLTNAIWIQAYVLKNYCAFSEQHINFPETPCGSFSLTSITLEAFNKKVDNSPHAKKNYKDFRACFEIFGDNNEIIVEPNIGVLKPGQKIEINFIARPQVPQNIIDEKAKIMKMEAMIEEEKQKLLKLEEEEVSKKSKKRNLTPSKKTSDKSGMKSKKSKEDKNETKSNKSEEDTSATKSKKSKEVKKKGSDKNNAEGKNADDKIITGYFDFYPAEMQIWRKLEPYLIYGKFNCRIKYQRCALRTTDDTFHISATCRVIQPDFIHNLNLQCIDFGIVPLGVSCTKSLKIQNIQAKPISPQISCLNPIGPFSTIQLVQNKIPPEFHLDLPITFSPTDEKKFTETFEVTSSRTIIPFVLRGEGVNPALVFKPDFLVGRLDASKNGSSDCKIEVINHSKAIIVLRLEKLCECKGQFKSKNVDSSIKSKGKKPNKDESTSKKSDMKVQKFSNQLSEEEIISLENSFTKSYDSMFNLVDNEIEVKPNGKASIVVKFGKVSKKLDGKKGKSEDSTVKSKDEKGKVGANSYVAKYNIFLGTSKFIRDLIFIGTFK